MCIRDRIKEALMPSMMEKNITLEISGGEFSVPAAYGHMHNLFGNLIQNAVKYLSLIHIFPPPEPLDMSLSQTWTIPSKH